MTPIWTTELPYSLTGSMVPVFDAVTGSLLVSDGWGTPFASLSLRRLSLSGGEVTGAARVRSAVYSTALSPSPESILVASGKRLLELERTTLRETRRWDKGGPQYAHRCVRIGDLAVCMSSRGPTVGLFAAQHKLPASLEAALVVHERELLIAIDTQSKQGVVSAWRIGLQRSPSLSWLTSA